MPQAVIDRERVVEAIYSAIDELNQMRPTDQRLSKSLSCKLVGPASGLDSMATVNLVIMAEEKILESLGVEINLADQSTVTQDHNPLETVATLVEYVSANLGNANEN